MKIWNHISTDTKRVRLLKNVTNHLHGEITSIATSPIVGISELKSALMINDFRRLNRRLKIARERDAKHFAQSMQSEFNLSRRSAGRKKRQRKYQKGRSKWHSPQSQK